MVTYIRISSIKPFTNHSSSRYTSAVCLITLCATAAGPLTINIDPSVEFIWSQAFYYGIYAAILYFVVASLMSVTFWGASSGHFSKNFDLTASQRTLMLQTILFLMYLLVGALIFHYIEGWEYLDAVYWADVTLFTVGFGDFATTTHLGRGLLIPYALIGVISLGLVIGSIRSMILERTHRRVGFRIQEMTRRRTVRNLAKRGTDDVLNPIGEDEAMESTPQGSHSNGHGTEYDRRKAEFSLMRRVQHRAIVRRRWMSMAISTSTWLVLWLVGAVVFLESEEPYQQGWNYFDSFYLCFVSLTTIGYGDRTPVSNAGKSFWVFWSLLALPTMTVLISNAGDTVVKLIHDVTDRIGAVTILPTMKKCPEDGSETSTAATASSDSGVQETLIQSPTDTTLNEKAAHSRRGRKRKHQNKHEPHQLTHQPDSEGHSHLGHFHHPASFTSGVQVPHRHHPLKELPTGRQFHLLLVTEMEHIMEHIRQGKNKHYSFEEWAWYLSLLGEDEHKPNTHRRARGHQKQRHGSRHGKGSATDAGLHLSTTADDEMTSDMQPHLKWSWVGNRSPISSGQDESDWILDRLTCRLKESLTEGRGF